ncbi:hypothetical protein [Synechococcus sp. CS-1328]|uniref:hypothetical protein n=1 Tax=Synechococcus sp. CS-1328 TaxID=2847976 RepID=UPI00223B0C4D|nr:hypothetical protein [Synechococcus sp. CS-1328]MCT0226022.1 hypothetical protein [Synechococcus sp. CS-1328]
MHFWAPEIDPAHPMDCTQAEHYVIKHLGRGMFLAVQGEDQHLSDVATAAEAHRFHTHEAAIRAAEELNRLGEGPVDVVKVE